MVRHPIIDDLRRFFTASDLEGIAYDSLAKMRLIDLVEKLPDSSFNSLEDDTVDWLNACIDASNRGELPPDLPQITPPPITGPLKEGRAKAVQSRAANRKNKDKPAHERIKEIMLDQGVYVTPRKLKTLLDKEGYQASVGTINAVKAEFRRSLYFLHKRKMLTQKPKGLK